ncbi:MAG: hypothetical protein EHM33_01955 [Chloroflexi bacterium]|nr:MAG: hypothetical protein EHM33_01955 [Chloroflexota bacterium]
MSIGLMSLVFKYRFPKRVEYEAIVYPFKRDKETKKILERSDTPEIRKLATTGSSCKAVLLALADHSNDDGKGAYPSVSTLELKTNLERPTVISAVLALQYHLFINFVGESPRETNNYDISPERLVKPFDQGGKASLPVKVNPVYRGGKASLPEPSITSPEPSSKDNEFAKIIKLYESNIEPITPLVATKLGYEFDSYYNEPDGPNWISWAIDIAVSNNARSFNYLKKCLSNRKKHGKSWKPIKTNGVKHESRKTDNPSSPEQDAASRALATEILAERAARQNASV